jgi:hypothetical protein
MANSKTGNLPKASHNELPRADSRSAALLTLRPWLELQLAIHMVKHPAEARRIDPERISNPLVRDLIAMLIEFPAIGGLCRLDELAMALHAEPELIRFAWWLCQVPSRVRDSLLGVYGVIDSLNYLNRSKEYAARVAASPKSWLKLEPRVREAA